MNLNDSKYAEKTEQIALMVSLALSVLSQRAVTILVLLLNAGIFSWAMYSESWVRIAGAALFAIASWCTVNLKPSKGDGDET